MRIPHYVFDTCLYRGDSTVVHAGTRESDGLSVVGKMVMGGRRDLLSELTILQRLSGPGVVEALGLFDSDDGPVMVQRRFGDGSLADALRAGPFPLARTLRIALHVATVLTRIHAERILHRDLKPANLLLDSTTDAIAVADFGIAVELPVQARVLPVSDLVGTPAYVAPEQTGRTREGCDTRSDLYSLGVTFYQMLTGTLPFDSEDLLDLVAAHLSKLPEEPSRRTPSVPPVVSAIVMKLLAKAPDQRYQSARGLAVDLKRCLDTLADDGTIAAFELGRSDLVRPKLTTRLYGRDAERAAFAAAYARAASGSPSLVLLSAREGAGRGEFVRGMLRTEAITSPCATGAWRAAGERPLAGISDALTDLSSKLLLLDDQSLSALRRRFAERLGQIGQVIVDVAPALADVVGPQPQLTELGPSEARGRMQHAFRGFALTLGEEHVFVLSLANVEHADAASMQLIQTLLGAAEGTRLLVVLSARDKSAFAPLGEQPLATSIELAGLSVEAVTHWTAAMLDCSVERCADLARALHERSAGNPRSFVNLLDHFVDTGVIDRQDGQFTWSLERVREAKAPPSLGALAAQRVAELAAEARTLLAAVALGDAACDPTVLAIMAEQEPTSAAGRLATLAREGLIEASSRGGFSIAHPAIVQSISGLVPEAERKAMQGRLGLYLLSSLSEPERATHAYRIASALSSSELELQGEQRVRAAQLYGLAADQATAVMAYDTAENFYRRGVQQLEETAWTSQRELGFRLQVGLARSLMMLAQQARADELLKEICARDLSPTEIGIVYPIRADNRTAVMDRLGSIEVGIEGMARLGFPMSSDPTQQEAIAPLIYNQTKLAQMTLDDHVNLPVITDQAALAANRICSTMSGQAAMVGRAHLYLAVLATGLQLNLKHGYTRNYAGWLATHAVILHGRLGNYDGARLAYAASCAVQKARPAPELDGRTYLVTHYMISPWFGPWKDAQEPLRQGMQLAIEAGDPLFAALSASASTTLMAMSGTPLDRIVSAVEGLLPIMRADGGVMANAANVLNLAGKLSRGEPIEQSDLDRVSNVSQAAGAMRNNAMVNFGLALSMIGHEAQVRTWLDEVRVTFPKVNPAQPHLVTVWLLDGLFAAKDAQAGQAERLTVTEQMLENLTKLQTQTKTTNHQPAIALLEAEIARAKGELDRASGLYGRAASEARTRELTHLVAYAMERRAQMLDEAGLVDEAALFYRECAIAYRRWMHLTKVSELEAAQPQLRTLDLGRSEAARHGTRGNHAGASRTNHATKGGSTTHGGSINESLDLATVLKVSQEISTQLHGSDVVRAVLSGVAQNAGAERALFIQRDASGDELVYGESQGGNYRNIGQPVSAFTGLPASALRLARRTARALIVADAMHDPAHASDPYVIETSCRSVAVIPVVRKGETSGFVVLENRLVAGAFTPQLITLTQALIAQAAISLDNASLYENMEGRVRERTAALNARNAEMRLVLDNVAQGLLMTDRQGRLLAERSAVLNRWFPEGVPDTLASVFANVPLFTASWDQLTDGFLPPELCIDQLPKHLRRGDQIFEVGWQVIVDASGEMTSMLVVLSDITELLRRQEAEQEQKQMMAIFERLSQDRNGVVEFAREASNIVRQLERESQSNEVEKRLVHTLKGNAAFFGLSGLSSLCHDVESALVAEERGLSPEERGEICTAWRAIDTRLGRFLDVGTRYMQVPRSDFESALRALIREGHPVAHDLELWKLEALETRFQRIGEQAQSLAERLGKAPLRIHAEHAGIRINGDIWAPLWAAFVHAIRNAVDHGLEPAEEREQLGKGVATISLRAYFSGASLIFEFGDDGRGIAWDKVRDKAQRAGLAHQTHENLVEALFSDGISTKEAADENSGRGVGMSALKDACLAMGARISVESEPGKGTTWRFEFPGHLAKLPRERRPSLLPSAYPPN